MSIVESEYGGCMIKKDKRDENFASKASIIGLSIKEQVDMLNKIYNKSIEFELGCNGIRISNIDENIFALELPENDNYDIENLIDISFVMRHNISSVKLPKTVKQVNLNRATWAKYIDRLFVWDDAEIIKSDSIGYISSYLKMIVVVYSTGKKTKIYKFN